MPENEKVNILVVDDLPEKLLVFQTVLEELGENTIIARSGEEALQRVLEQEFAVILLDVHMPGMDGYETAAYIRRRKKSAHTPIIFITSYADHVQTVEGYTLGAVDYIFSPVVPEILRTKVKVFVNLFRMTQQVRRQADERVALAREQAARLSAEEATRRLSFLAEASTILGSSLNIETTQRNVACMVVPHLADVASVTVTDDYGGLGPTEFSWTNDPEISSGTGPLDEAGSTSAPARPLSGPASIAQSQPCEAPGLKNNPRVRVAPMDLPPPLRQAIEQVLRTRKSVHLRLNIAGWPRGRETGSVPSLATPAGLEAAAAGLKRAIVLPLLARGHSLGALTLAVALSGRQLEHSDLALAEDMAGRAAIALDNARLYQNIQENDRRKNEFLVMLAHELRNPLAPIRNAVEVLRLADTSQPILAEASEMIARQVTHLARLIDDLLDMSRLAHGKILLRRQQLDLVELVRSVASDYRPTLERSGLQLEVQLPGQPLIIDGDSTRLTQIVGNVLHNANKFTDAGGRVTVELTVEADSNGEPPAARAGADRHFARIAIRDTGIGMEPQMLNRIFETFSQADTSLDRNRGGLGLGLALVRGLLDLHGGSVRAHSEGLGKGTEVILRLPLVPKPEQQPQASSHPHRPRHPEARRILIIEDNRDAAESMRLLLALTGHQVAVANSGVAGIESARNFRPDIVLCDIGLPGGMDGYAVAQAIRKDPDLADARLVALTGYGQEQDQRRSREAGFNAHVVKPVDFIELEQLLAKLPNETDRSPLP